MDRHRLTDAAAAHGAELIVQFGSTVTGATHAGSDIDLAVLFADAPESYAVEADLQAALQSAVPDRAWSTSTKGSTPSKSSTP